MMHELIELIGRRGPENGNASLNELGAGRCADLTSATVEASSFPPRLWRTGQAASEWVITTLAAAIAFYSHSIIAKQNEYSHRLRSGH